MAFCVQSSFFDYESGVYDQEDCCTDNNHALIITGYGTDPNHGDFWIVKNSYGKNSLSKFLG